MTVHTLEPPSPSPVTSTRIPFQRTHGPYARPQSRVRATRAALLMVLGVAALDVGLFGVSAGAGLAVCWVLLAAVLLGMRQRRKVDQRTVLLLMLLGTTAVQTVVEPGVANLVVGWSLVVALAGAVRFPWHPLTDAVLAAAPWGWRWFSVPRRIRMWFRPCAGTKVRKGDNARAGVTTLAVPALVTLGFLGLLVAGNPVLAHQLAWFGDALGPMLEDVPSVVDGWRVAFWCVAAGFTVVLMRPAAVDRSRSGLLDGLERAPVDGERAAWTLAGANVVFAWANGVDAVYLWFTRSLPAGISYSEYVHQGVNNLTLAVLVAAAMMALLFRGGPPSVRARRLGHLFLLQNLMVVAGVALRDALYMDAYGHTEKRMHVLVFLGLVTVGFLLLWPFVRGARELRWLLRTNAVAAFFTLWMVQFADTAGVSAQWQHAHAHRGMDAQGASLSGLVDLGVRGLPARAALAMQGVTEVSTIRWEALMEAQRMNNQGWRGISLRRYRDVKEALATLGVPWPAH